MAYMKPVPGICDKCGLRYALKDLKFEFVLGRSTGLRCCPKCLDPSHPQLDTRNVRTDDKQSVPNSRSDAPELPAERAMFAWNPVGTPLTSTLEMKVGRVFVPINDVYPPLLPSGYSYVILTGSNPPEYVMHNGSFVIHYTG